TAPTSSVPGGATSSFSGATGGFSTVQGSQQQASTALDVLDALLPSISKPASLQPANSASLSRSIANTFAKAQDTGPQLLAAFRPTIAQTIYRALGSAAV